MTSSAETKAATIHRGTKLTHPGDAGTVPVSQFDLAEGLRSILRSAGELMEIPLSLIALRRYEAEPLRLIAFHQTKTSFSPSQLETLSQSLPAGWALNRQQVVYLSQAQLESKFTLLPGLTEVIYVPLITPKKGAGVLCLVNVEPHRPWGDEAPAFAQRLAHQAGLMIEMSRAVDDVKRCLSQEPREKEAMHSLLVNWEAMQATHVHLINDEWQRTRQLIAAEAKFQALADGGQNAVVIIQDDRFRYVNHRLTEILGFSPEECYQMEMMLDLVVERHRSMVIENQRKNFQGEKVPPYEFIAKSKDGAEVALEAVGTVIQHERRPALQEIWRDVTQQRQLRAQFLLSEKMAAMGQLIAGVAHELNNPLTAVLGFSELILLDHHLSEELRKDLKMITSEAHRARKIVQNLLSFAQPSDSEKRLIDLNQVINETADLKEYESRMNHIEIIKQLDSNLPPVIADQDQLKQVFLNIIVNAEQAMAEIRVHKRLVIKTGVKTSYVAGSASDCVEIRLRDTGPGIPLENLNRIFELFFTTKEFGKGTGLGLAVSQNIIKDHGGRIYAQNAPGGGAEFIIELPVQGARSKEPGVRSQE
jgi:PAS domain S-box-containing protein